MSKKIAAGADAIVLDVKVGHGAFMATAPEATQLAELMLRIGRNLGRRMSALIGDMSQPLGLAVGNALEVTEAIETLHGNGPADFRQHCLDVAAEMLLLGKVAATQRESFLLAEAALDSGSAWTKFRQFVAAQGGDLAQVEDPRLLPAAPIVAPLRAPGPGYVTRVDAREIGFTVVDLGGGRVKKSDTVDPAVGLRLSPHAKLGAKVESEQPLLWVHARSNKGLENALSRLKGAYSYSDKPIEPPPLIHQIIREVEPSPGS